MKKKPADENKDEEDKTVELKVITDDDAKKYMSFASSDLKSSVESKELLARLTSSPEAQV
jgi:hypothetical protein